MLSVCVYFFYQDLINWYCKCCIERFLLIIRLRNVSQIHFSFFGGGEFEYEENEMRVSNYLSCFVWFFLVWRTFLLNHFTLMSHFSSAKANWILFDLTKWVHHFKCEITKRMCTYKLVSSNFIKLNCSDMKCRRITHETDSERERMVDFYDSYLIKRKSYLIKGKHKLRLWNRFGSLPISRAW